MDAPTPRRPPGRDRAAQPDGGMSGGAWLSISDLGGRWSCGRTTVYKAIREMEGAGYLRRLTIGERDQRVALASVLRWEELRSAPRGEQGRRGEMIERRPSGGRRARAAPLAQQPPGSIRDAWRKMKAA